MKFLKSTVFSVSLLFLSLNSVSAKNEYKAYKSPSKYSINYPTNWVQEEYKTGDFTFIIFKSPPESAQDQFSENLNIVAENAPGYTVDQYTKVSLNTIQSSGSLKEFKVLEQGNAKVNKRDGKYVIYTHSFNNEPLKVKAYITCNGKKCFVLTGTTTFDTYEKYKPYFESMVSTFKY